MKAVKAVLSGMVLAVPLVFAALSGIAWASGDSTAGGFYATAAVAAMFIGCVPLIAIDLTFGQYR